MLRRTAAYMKQQQINLNGEKVIIGLSGGMDSVCLFHILKDLGVSLEAVHVNHQIRGEEAKRDEQFVKNLCARYNIPFHGYRYDVPKISREKHLSEEEAGRMVRKEAFARVMKEQGAGYVALAHHGNDRAETFLFHLSRGTGVKGLGSMKPVQGTIIRPLLWAERKEIEQYVQEKGYEFVEDATNSQTEYTRNKIRHEIIPALEEINPRCIPHICGAAEKLSAVSAYIDREAEKLCRLSAVMYGQEVQILKLAFEQGDEVLRIPNEQLLCIVRGCNVLMLDKLDYTRHPYSKMIREVSIYDYKPEIPEPSPVIEEPASEEKPKKKSRAYGSANPPADF